VTGSPLTKPENISWTAAQIELPEIPMLPPGADAMSATISAVLPTLAAQLTANVATLAAKEHMYSGKVVESQAAYATGDQSGSQSVGQIVGMLGKLGEQAGQMAGAPSQAAQGGSGMFGSLIEQVMKAAQGGGGGEAGQSPAGGAPVGAAPAGGAPAPGQPPGAPAPGQPGRDPLEERVERLEERAEREDRPAEQQPAQQAPQREPLMRADEGGLASGPQEGAGPAPVSPPEPRRSADDDLGRRL